MVIKVARSGIMTIIIISNFPFNSNNILRLHITTTKLRHTHTGKYIENHVEVMKKYVAKKFQKFQNDTSKMLRWPIFYASDQKSINEYKKATLSV